MIGAILTTLLLLWMALQMRSLLSMIVISIFLSLALEPAVRWLHKRFGWRRGAAVAAIYFAGILFLVLMVAVLIPAIVDLAHRVGEDGPDWADSLNGWTDDTFGIEIVGEEAAASAAGVMDEFVGGWAEDAFGAVTGIASAGATLLFSLGTIAMFVFYFTADSHRITRTVLGWFRPVTQERLAWTLDQAIVQTGGYFYSRTLLMIISGAGFFFVMVAVGLPLAYAFPLAIFGGFVSVFIPVIGTYLGAAVPILVTLAVQGFTAALIVLGYVLVYQLFENNGLSPKISAKTMNLSGGLAFGAALAGGSLAGPIGAFVALPTAALLASLVSNYARTYEVTYEPEDDDEPQPPGSSARLSD